MQGGARDDSGTSGLCVVSAIRDSLRAFSVDLEPGVLKGDLAEQMVSVATEIRNLASRTGGSAVELDKAVATQRRVETMSHLSDAASGGSLSLRQVDEISRAVAVDASVEHELIDLASKTSLLGSRRFRRSVRLVHQLRCSFWS